MRWLRDTKNRATFLPGGFAGRASPARATEAVGWPGAPPVLALGLGLALYGNAFALLDSLTRLPLGGTVGGVLLGVGAFTLARRQGPDSLAEIGIRRQGLGRSLLWGIVLGLLLGLPGALYFLRPDLVPLAIENREVSALTLPVFLALVLLKIPLATALAEELAFRGLLQARLRARFGPSRAILLSTLVFVAWHFVVSARTLLDTNLGADLLLAPLAYLGQNLAVLLAGLLFGLLRECSGNLAGPIAAHWLVDVLLLGGLYFGR